MNTATATAPLDARALSMRAAVMGLDPDGLSTPAKIKKERAKILSAAHAADKKRRALLDELAKFCEGIELHEAARELAGAAQVDWVEPRMEKFVERRTIESFIAGREEALRGVEKNGAVAALTRSILRLEKEVLAVKIFDEFVPPASE